MTYLKEVKDEASKLKVEESRLILAELAGFVRIASQLVIKEGRVSLNFYSDNASVARRIFTSLKSYTDDIASYSKKSKNSTIYYFEIEDEYVLKDLLHDTGYLEGDNIFDIKYQVDKQIVNEKDEIQAYIRALFLGGGYIFDPEKTYHLEIQSTSAGLIDDIIEKLKLINLNAKSSNRNDLNIMYIKDPEQIADFLVNIGAINAMFKLEDYRTIKDLRNNINRRVNFETANINKLVSASMRHIDDINYIVERDAFSKLDEDLKQVALMRVENPDASLSELADTSGIFSKAAINYRLKKISEFAKKLRGV